MVPNPIHSEFLDTPDNENKGLQQTIFSPLWEYISKDGVKLLAPWIKSTRDFYDVLFNPIFLNLSQEECL
jgi:hypothetical protein